MSTLPQPPFLCIITDEELSDDRIVAAAAAACAAGPLVVQLRARHRSGAELFDLAHRLRAMTAADGSRLIVNDRLDVALAVRADGIHLPASGIPAHLARDLIVRHARGQERPLVGLSVHSVDEIHATAPYVDYFHFGPVFATASKAAYGPPQGLKKLADAVAASAAVQRPLIAVGGIDPVNAQAVIDSGAAGIAVIGAVMRASDPRAAAATLLERITRRRA